MIEWDKLKAMPKTTKSSGVRWDELKAMPDVSSIQWDELKRLREKPIYAAAIRQANERLAMAESVKKPGSEYKIGLDETWDMDYDGRSTEELLYDLACEKYGIPNDRGSYLERSGRQMLLGNYTDDVTALGTAGQIALGLTGLDAPADVRDLYYDLTHWDWSLGHAGQTALDAISLLPGVGAIKYVDEAGEVLQNGLKRLGKTKKLPEAARNNADITQNLPDSLPEAEQNYINKYIDAVNRYIDKSVESQNRYIDTGYGAMNAQIDKIKEVRELTDDEWDATMGEFLEILDERKAAEGIGEFSDGFAKNSDITGKLWREDAGADADKPTKGAGDLIDGIKITDGKVGGKIPVDEFKKIRQSSIKNPESTTLTLGKFTPIVENGIEDWSKSGPDSYIAKAGKSSYFDLGSDYKVIQKKYGLKDSEMFDYLNKPALEEAISKSKTIRFSHNPLDYEKGAIVDEWEYIKSALGKTDSNLIKIGDYWYVR